MNAGLVELVTALNPQQQAHSLVLDDVFEVVVHLSTHAHGLAEAGGTAGREGRGGRQGGMQGGREGCRKGMEWDGDGGGGG